MPKKPKKKSISKLKKEADKWFSLYIRNRDHGICISCGVQKAIKEMQCGHYIPRDRLATRYDEWNCHAQCVACNIFKKGNMPAYTIGLMEKHGDNIIKELFRKSKKLKQMKIADYEELIETYKNNQKDFNS